MVEVHRWDMADHIKTGEDVVAYLDAALQENDTELALCVIGAIARSEGMTQIARELNVARESLYRSLSGEGNPSFHTVLRVLDVLGYRISLKVKTA